MGPRITGGLGTSFAVRPDDVQIGLRAHGNRIIEFRRMRLLSRTSSVEYFMEYFQDRRDCRDFRDPIIANDSSTAERSESE